MKPSFFILALLFLFNINSYAQYTELIESASKKSSQKDFIGAIDILSKAIELDSNNAIAFIARGNSCKLRSVWNSSFGIQVFAHILEQYLRPLNQHRVA